MIVNLDKNYGFNSSSIKNLLEDFSLFDKAVDSGEITLRLPSKPDKISELATVMIWMKMRSVNGNTRCKKKFKIDEKSKTHFDEQHFFDRLSKTEERTFFRKSKKVPFHFETFNLSQDENVTARKISNAIDETISEKPLASEIKTHISELVNNAFHHSVGQEVGCTSRMDEKSGLFTFCISDTGKGVRDSFLRNPALSEKYKKMSDSMLLRSVTQKNITCNPHDAPQYSHSNSGIGLYYLTQFCKFHQGKMVIISDRGYYYVDGKIERFKNFNSFLTGTSVYFTAKISEPMADEYKNLVDQFLIDFDEEDQFNLV